MRDPIQIAHEAIFLARAEHGDCGHDAVACFFCIYMDMLEAELEKEIELPEEDVPERNPVQFMATWTEEDE